MNLSLEIFKTDYWLICHRIDSRYPGYLMISAREDASKISELTKAALNEMGDILARTEKLLIKVYQPFKVITLKFGFSKGYSCHFHMIPISSSLLDEIKENPNYTSDEADGIDATLFINREYCEKLLTAEERQNIIQEVLKLRNYYEQNGP
jgi:diadenosine tetraphosphate (Ap4A) HIT family hydrolase